MFVDIQLKNPWKIIERREPYHTYDQFRKARDHCIIHSTKQGTKSQILITDKWRFMELEIKTDWYPASLRLYSSQCNHHPKSNNSSLIIKRQ